MGNLWAKVDPSWEYLRQNQTVFNAQNRNSIKFRTDHRARHIELTQKFVRSDVLIKNL